MTNLNPMEIFNSWQAMLQPPAAVRNAATQRLADFWSNQEKFLESMEAYTHQWFERRHMDARSALTASRHIAHVEAPSDVIREYQTWAMSCFDRVMNDNLAGYQQLMAMGELFAKPAFSGETKKTDTDRAESRDKQVNRPKAA